MRLFDLVLEPLRGLIQGQPADDIQYGHAPDESLRDRDVHGCASADCGLLQSVPVAQSSSRTHSAIGAPMARITKGMVMMIAT